MTKRISLAPALLVLALVAAFMLGTVGSATAGSLTTKSVKKIAAKVVAKKASSLSVAHAATAGSATTATTAGNAAQLGGAAPSAYTDRAAHENLTSSTGLTGGIVTQVNNPTPITVPAGVKLLHITGVATFATGSTDVSYWPAVDANCAASGAAFDHRGRGNTTAGQVSVAVDFLVAVTPGDHAVRMCAAGTANTNIENRSFTAVTVTAGPTG